MDQKCNELIPNMPNRCLAAPNLDTVACRGLPRFGISNVSSPMIMTTDKSKLEPQIHGSGRYPLNDPTPTPYTNNIIVQMTKEQTEDGHKNRYHCPLYTTFLCHTWNHAAWQCDHVTYAVYRHFEASDSVTLAADNSTRMRTMMWLSTGMYRDSEIAQWLKRSRLKDCGIKP